MHREHVRRVVLLVKVHNLPPLERSHDCGCEVARGASSACAVRVVDPAGDGERANGRRSRAVCEGRRGARWGVHVDEVARRTVRGSAVVVVAVGHLGGHDLCPGWWWWRDDSRGLVVVRDCDYTHMYCLGMPLLAGFIEALRTTAIIAQRLDTEAMCKWHLLTLLRSFFVVQLNRFGKILDFREENEAARLKPVSSS